MINERLQDFAARATALGHVSFGDVRRLERDYLPGGIATREDAEIVISVHASLVRADKAWAQWLVPALAQFVMSQQIADAERAWVDGMLAASPAGAALARSVARYIRRQSAQPAAEESTEAPQRPRRKVRTCKAERARRRSGSIVRSDVRVRRSRRAVAPPKHRATGATILPCELWSAGLMEKHWQFQLARPAA